MGRRTTADTPLTVKQTKFAAHVATGTARVHALAAAGYVPQREATARKRRAQEIASRPNVAAEIRRLTWLSCPPVADVAGMREHAVRVISDLSRSDPSGEVRLKAALALYKIAETTMAAAAPTATDDEQSRLLGSLRRLYVEVQGSAVRAEQADADLGDEPIDITALLSPAAQAQAPSPGDLEPAAAQEADAWDDREAAEPDPLDDEPEDDDGEPDDADQEPDPEPDPEADPPGPPDAA